MGNNKYFQITINLLIVLLSLFLTYLILLLNPVLVTVYYHVGVVVVPMIAFGFANAFVGITIYVFRLRIRLKYSFFRLSLIAVVGMTWLIVAVAWTHTPLDGYFGHVDLQKYIMEMSQTDGYVEIGHPNAVVIWEEKIPEGYILSEVATSQTMPSVEWLHLYKPSLFKGADDYLAVYDVNKKQVVGLQPCDEIWSEFANNHPLTERTFYEGESFDDLNKDEVKFDTSQPAIGKYVVTLGYDGTKIVVKSGQFVR